MATNSPGPDELSGTEQPFVAHLIELRDRLVRAAIAVGVVFAALCLWPGPGGLYDIIAAPMIAASPSTPQISAVCMSSGAAAVVFAM